MENLNSNSVSPGNLSHKQRKALWKKQKRKIRRQTEAKIRDEENEQDEEQRKNSPSYLAQLEEQRLAEEAERLRIEDESRHQHELWLWSEEVFAERQRQKKLQEEREEQQRLEIERKIKEEWEERQRKEKEEEEERKKKKEKQDELLRKAREGENKNGEWHNPLAPVQYGQERQVEACPFFAKVGACRFGDRCSRSHPYPESGSCLLFMGMFKHFQLDQGLCEEYDTDIVLEYEDSEVYQKFKEFFEDTLPEFKEAGRVIQFKVCCNFQPHLRGNVYVAYARETDAMQAYTRFNARWYGGKQMTAQFVHIPSWRRAICGLFGKGKCPKGRECNFLHVFNNPSNEFNYADRDLENFTPRRQSSRASQRGSRSPDRRRRYSRSPSKSSRNRRRSRERYKGHSSRRSKSRSRSRERKMSHRSKHSSYRRSRSRSRYSRSRSRSRHRSRSKERHSRSRSKEKHFRSRSKDRHSKSDQSTKNGVAPRYSDEEESEMVWVEKTTVNDKHAAKDAEVKRSRSKSRDRHSKKQKKKKKNKE